jgi:hypothetical protein
MSGTRITVRGGKFWVLICGSRYVARMPRIKSCTDPRTDELPDTYTYDDAKRVLDGTLFFSVEQKKIAHAGISGRCRVLNGTFLLFIFYVLLFLFRRKRRNKK